MTKNSGIKDIEKSSIRIFKTEDNFYEILKKYVSAIEENINNDDELQNICKHLKNFIEKQFNNAVVDTKEIVYLANGSTSYCYRSVHNSGSKDYIYKVFAPSEFARCKNCYKNQDEKWNEYCFILDCVSSEQRQSFFKRFVRFINQKEEINSYIDKAKDGGNNTFVNPELLFTSKGFVFAVEGYVSCTLEEAFRDLKDKLTLENISSVVELVCEASENIRDYCHNNDVYNGDIKPENFLKIKISDSKSFIRNIDFDTWIDKDKLKNGYNKSFSATTPLFYAIDKHTSMQQEFKTWLHYDVKALSKMLMYALSLLGNKDVLEEFNDLKTLDWETYLFRSPSCAAKTMYTFLEADKKLSRLFIFQQIKECLLWNISNNETMESEIEIFISKLKNIKCLLDYELHSTKPDSIDDLFMRYMSLKRLDAEIENGTPFALQCFADFISECATKNIEVNYDYDILSSREKVYDALKKRYKVKDRLQQDFVKQVLNKSFEEETTVN